jgi:predicted permease
VLSFIPATLQRDPATWLTGGAMNWRQAIETNLFAFARDVRFGVRLLGKTPGFTTIAILTLALGIGANTAAFSLLYALAFRDLPVPHPEQLVRFGPQKGADSDMNMSLPMFEEIARSQTVFSDVFACWCPTALDVEAGQVVSVSDVWAVTGNFQAALGAVPEIGRLIVADDVDLHGGPATQVAVLGYNFWQRYYGGASNVIGQTVRIEGVPFTIVGVTRRGFQGIRADVTPDVTLPLPAEAIITRRSEIQKYLRRRESRWLVVVGRLRPGVTLPQARAQLESQWPAIREAVLPENQSPAELDAFRALPLRVASGAKGDSGMRERFIDPLYLFFGLAGLVLLIACVNLASLTLARTTSRSHEIGVRIALGATRARLVQQMLTESLLLSLAGMLAGLAFAQWSSRALSGYILGQTTIIPAALNLSLDWRILLFSAAAAVLTGILFGIIPAWRFTGEARNVSVQESSRIIGAGTGLLGKTLVVAQIALSLVLLAAAGLFTQTLHELRTADPGYRASGVLSVSAFGPPGGFRNVDFAKHYRELTTRIEALPHVVSAAVMDVEPGSRYVPWTEQARIAGGNAGMNAGGNGGTSAAPIRVDFDMQTPQAFRTLEIGILRGRDFRWSDDTHAPHVAIVSRSFAEQLFPGRDAMGQRIEIPSRPEWPSAQIVGIVADATLYDRRQHAPPTVYVPMMQYDSPGSLLVRTEVPAAAIAGALRQAIESFGLERVFRIQDLSAVMDHTLLRERITAMLATVFGGLALLLSAIGLYGLMAYNVTRRTREIGIRMALGARRESVRWLILRESLLLALLGIATGLPCAMGSSRFIAHLLFRATMGDPAILAGVCGILIAVAAVASWLPAYRAARVDPMIALRHD